MGSVLISFIGHTMSLQSSIHELVYRMLLFVAYRLLVPLPCINVGSFKKEFPATLYPKVPIVHPNSEIGLLWDFVHKVGVDRFRVASRQIEIIPRIIAHHRVGKAHTGRRLDVWEHNNNVIYVEA